MILHAELVMKKVLWVTSIHSANASIQDLSLRWLGACLFNVYRSLLLAIFFNRSSDCFCQVLPMLIPRPNSAIILVMLLRFVNFIKA